MFLITINSNQKLKMMNCTTNCTMNCTTNCTEWYKNKTGDICCRGNEKIITGIGVIIRSESHYTGEEEKCETKCEDKTTYAFFEDNRVLLTKEEQKEIGDWQPFLLQPRTYKNNLMKNGTELTDKELGEMIYKRKNECDEVPNDFTDEDAYKIVKKARDYYNRFSKKNVGPDLCFSRHLLDFMFRKKLGKETLSGEMIYEDIMTALDKLLKEELNRKFKSYSAREKYNKKIGWVCEGSDNCTINWVIDLKDTVIDYKEKRLHSKYFCAKKLPEICDNNKTRNIKFLTLNEIQKRMNAFQVAFAHCDTSILSKWTTYFKIISNKLF